MVGRRTVGALALLVALAGLALAGDAAAARRYIDSAREELKANNDSWVESHLRRAEQALEGLDAATRAPLERDIAQVRQEFAAEKRRRDKEDFTRALEQALEHAKYVLDNTREQDESMQPGFGEALERVQSWVTSDERKELLTPQERQAYLTRASQLDAAAGAHAVGARLFHADRAVKRAEEINAGTEQIRYTNEMDGALELCDTQLAKCPPDDPRTRALAERLQRAKAEWARQRSAADKEETIKAAVDYWQYMKENNGDDVQGWEQESIDYTRWRQQGELDFDKTERRYDLAKQMQDDERFKKAVAAHASEPAIQAMVAEVTRWREEASQKRVRAATAVLDEAEDKVAEQPEDLASDLQRLKDDLERNADAPARDAPLAKLQALFTRAMAEAETQKKAREEQEAVEEAAAAEKAEEEREAREDAKKGGLGFFGVLMGLFGCFLMVAGGGAVGFAGFKLSQLSKPAAPPSG
jgi:hypothetical protein